MLDDLDRRILTLLRTDARLPTAKIAAQLGVARTTVHTRVTRMEKQGTIAGYSVVLRDASAEATVQVVIMLEVQQKETARIIKRLEGYPEIRLCLSINGDYDLLLSAEAPRIEDLDVLVDALGAMPGVLRTNTSVVFGRRIDR